MFSILEISQDATVILILLYNNKVTIQHTLLTLKTMRHAEREEGQCRAFRHKSGHFHTVTPISPSPRVWSTPLHSKPERHISFTRLSSVSTQKASCSESSLRDLPLCRSSAFFSWYSLSRFGLSTFLICEILTARSRSFKSHVWRLTAFSMSFASLESPDKVYWQSKTAKTRINTSHSRYLASLHVLKD